MGISKGRFVSESLALAEQGVVVFTPSWPTGRIAVFSQERGKKYRELYEVMTCAVRYARAYADRFGGDASQVALVGHSAGAAYGAWVALGGEELNDEWEAFAATRDGPNQQVKCVESGFSGDVESFIGIGGQFWFSKEIQEVDEELAEIVNPHLQLRSNPTLKVRLLHGEGDNISVDHPMKFNDFLTGEGYDSSVILFDGGHFVPIDLTVEVIYELAGY
jgi:pimeloyl-ACP methyl ester carboxylesterase